MKSVNSSHDDFRDCIVQSRRDESELYFDNPQRSLDHSITQKLFDDMGNIAGGSDENYFSKQSGYVKTKAVPYREPSDAFAGDSKNVNNEFPYEGTYYKSNRRVAPIYMANPYQPDSLDRAEI